MDDDDGDDDDDDGEAATRGDGRYSWWGIAGRAVVAAADAAGRE